MAEPIFSRLFQRAGNRALKIRNMRPTYSFIITSTSVLSLLLMPDVSRAQSLPSIEETIADAKQLNGYFNLYWSNSTAKLYWEIDQLNSEFLYQVSMASGLGSNPVGIDRGQLNGTYVLSPKRIGPRLLLMQSNFRYRASSNNARERQAVEDSFASSVLWGFDIVAETEGRVLIDASNFFLRDATDVSGTLANRGQGDFKLDISYSIGPWTGK